MSFLCRIIRIGCNNGYRKLINNTRYNQIVSYSCTPLLMQQKSTPAIKPEAQKDNTAESATQRLSSRTHKVNDFERRLLIWTGKYKTSDEIPTFVNQEVVDRARSKMRIRVANLMMILTAIGCVIMIMSGKDAQDKGESITKMNLDWHKEYNQQKALEQKSNSDK